MLKSHNAILLTTYYLLLTTFFSLLLLSCTLNQQKQVVEQIGQDEYNRIMSLSLDDFDQSYEGFRQYGDQYDLVSMIIPEYIRVNKLNDRESRNLHWHLGQIHAFNDNYVDAIKEMRQSYSGGSKSWECYVSGSIAFLERDKEALKSALEILSQQENQMNIEFLEKFVKYFDQSYFDAYNAEY